MRNGRTLELERRKATIHRRPSPIAVIDKGYVTAISVAAGTATITFGGSDNPDIPVDCTPFPTVGTYVWVENRGGAHRVIGVESNPAGNPDTGIVGFTRAASAHPGWLFCNGGAIDVAHTALRALVGTTTPDWRNRLGVGAGSTYTLGTTGNFTVGTSGGALPYIPLNWIIHI